MYVHLYTVKPITEVQFEKLQKGFEYIRKEYADNNYPYVSSIHISLAFFAKGLLLEECFVKEDDDFRLEKFTQVTKFYLG